MGRHGGRPSPNFSGLLAGKCVHVAPKKGTPFLDTRARMSQGELLQPEEGYQLTCDGIKLNSGMVSPASQNSLNNTGSTRAQPAWLCHSSTSTTTSSKWERP